MIQMSMHGGNHEVVVFVLRFRQLLPDSMGMMVVDQGDGAHHDRSGIAGPLPHQPVADQIPKSLGTIRVSALLNGTIEPLQQVRVQRNPDSAQNAHTHTRFNSRLSRGRIRVARE